MQRKKTAEVKKSVAKVRPKKIDKAEGYEDKDWHTDDSDWDYTDKEEDGDEDEIISTNIAKKSQKRSKSHNTVDDGDKDTYLARCLYNFL